MVNDATDVNLISIDQIRIEAKSVCSTLQIQPPKVVAFGKGQGSRIRNNGEILEVAKCTDLDICRYNIGRAYWTLLVHRSPNWFTRHSMLIDITIMVFTIPNLIISLIFLGYLLLPFGLLASSVLQLVYILIAQRMSVFHIERAEILSNAMYRIGVWSEQKAAHFIVQFPKGAFYRLLIGPFIIMTFCLLMSV
ncbi:MAG: hypothetical protein P1Q69_07070 [Candidatus Thorarchaeota archaeon]|nr:hypothetical protein [Candidatus Thorarchaeota archaeon]